MKMRLTVIVIINLLFASAAHAEDSKLIGKWIAVDQPGKWAEFHSNGSFQYAYELGPIPTVLSVFWKTGWFSKLTLSEADDKNPIHCHYTLDNDNLTIDAGAGKSCIEQLKMAQQFKRMH